MLSRVKSECKFIITQIAQVTRMNSLRLANQQDLQVNIYFKMLFVDVLYERLNYDNGHIPFNLF